MGTPAPPRRVRLLGGEVDLITPWDVLRRIDAAAAADDKPVVIANHNAHSLFLLRRSESLQAFFAEADLIQIDSVPLILWGQLLGLPLKRAMRSTYLDWRDDFWRLAEARRWRVYYLGGAPGVAETAAAQLSARYPNVDLGYHHGYFEQRRDAVENREVQAEITEFDPHVLLVGMGMPLQEAWTRESRGSIRRGAILTVGAAFDYEAGTQAPAPRWTGALGLEWLARLIGQPTRLAGRYLVEPWSLIGPALGDIAAALARPRSAAR